MAVVIIEDEEKLEKEIDGATFYYKRVPSGVRNRMLAACTSKRSGNVDWGKYSAMLLNEGLTGWKDVINRRGEQIAFSKELIGYIPDTIQAELVTILGENTDQMEGALKNSPTTPSSKPSTTD